MALTKTIVKDAIGRMPARAVTAWWYRLGGFSTPELKDRVQVAEAIPSAEESFKRLTFTFALIALSARVASCGGLSKVKYAAFRDAFPLSGGLCPKIRSLFTLAYEHPAPLEQTVTQVKHAFPRKSALFEALLDRLFSIARADGSLPREAERMLAKIAHMLGLSPSTYAAIHERHHRPIESLFRHMPKETLKTRYRELMKRYHPDRFAFETTSPEIDLLLHLKASEINQAYRLMSRKTA